METQNKIDFDFGSDLDFLRARISLSRHPKSDVVSDDDMRLLPENEVRTIKVARIRRQRRNQRRAGR